MTTRKTTLTADQYIAQANIKTAAEYIVEAILEQLDDNRQAWIRFDFIKEAAAVHEISKEEVDGILIKMMDRGEIRFKMGNPGRFEDKEDLMKFDGQIYTHCHFAS